MTNSSLVFTLFITFKQLFSLAVQKIGLDLLFSCFIYKVLSFFEKYVFYRLFNGLLKISLTSDVLFDLS